MSSSSRGGAIEGVVIGLVMLIVATGWMLTHPRHATPEVDADRWAFCYATDLDIDHIIGHARRADLGGNGRDVADLVFSPAFVRGAPATARSTAAAVRRELLAIVGRPISPHDRAQVARQYHSLVGASKTVCVQARTHR